jgi:type IX secretion system PorP/SprF family membrane protein
VKRKKLISILVLLLNLGLFFKLFAQQNPHYSTYMFNHFSINPAYCGSKQTLYINTVQRYQWISFTSGAPRSQSLNIQYSNKKRKVGLGLNVLNDQLGATVNQSILATYAYHLKMPVGKLSLGIRAGAQSLLTDFRKINYEDKTDNYNNLVIRHIIPTGDFGLYYYTQDFYSSLSLNNLWGTRLSSFKDTISYKRLVPHLFFTTGKAFVVNPYLIINPSIQIKKTQGAPFLFDYNCNIRIGERFWAGVSYRSKVSTVVLTQIAVTEKLRFGYAFDIGINKLGTFAGATHEFYLGYDINIHNNKIISARYL